MASYLHCLRPSPSKSHWLECQYFSLRQFTMQRPLFLCHVSHVAPVFSMFHEANPHSFYFAKWRHASSAPRSNPALYICEAQSDPYVHETDPWYLYSARWNLYSLCSAKRILCVTNASQCRLMNDFPLPSRSWLLPWSAISLNVLTPSSWYLTPQGPSSLLEAVACLAHPTPL